MNRIEELEKKLNKDEFRKFTASMRGVANPALYTNTMLFLMDEISEIEKILNEFGLKIHAIGADLDGDGMYIETAGR